MLCDCNMQGFTVISFMMEEGLIISGWDHLNFYGATKNCHVLKDLANIDICQEKEMDGQRVLVLLIHHRMPELHTTCLPYSAYSLNFLHLSGIGRKANHPFFVNYIFCATKTTGSFISFCQTSHKKKNKTKQSLCVLLPHFIGQLCEFTFTSRFSFLLGAHSHYTCFFFTLCLFSLDTWIKIAMMKIPNDNDDDESKETPMR